MADAYRREASGKETDMARTYVYAFIIIAVVCVGLVAYLVIPRSASARITGTVTAVDAAGMATVKTANGEEHRMTGAGWKVGDMVECAMEDAKMVCTKS
jgi:hypothetical protein